MSSSPSAHVDDDESSWRGQFVPRSPVQAIIFAPPPPNAGPAPDLPVVEDRGDGPSLPEVILDPTEINFEPTHAPSPPGVVKDAENDSAKNPAADLPQVPLEQDVNLVPTQAPSLPKVPLDTETTPTIVGAVTIEVLKEKLESSFMSDSVHDAAAHWLIHVDRMRLDAGAANLLQRYALAVLYFSTGKGSKSDGWTYCGAAEASLENVLDCFFEMESDGCDKWQNELLLDERCQYVDRSGDSIESFRYLSSTHECEWMGVRCNGKLQVTRVELDNNGLVGRLPAELGLLSALERCTLEENRLTGTIPDFDHWGEKMTRLSLIHNELSGEIPESMYHRFASLRRLELDFNNLSGTIHPDIGKYWTKMEILGLSNNYLMGNPFPSSMASMTKLATLLLEFNDWNKPQIPAGDFWNKLTNLKRLLLSRSYLVGTIPTELGVLSKLDTLSVLGNSLTGTLPTELLQLSKLETFRTEWNELTGEIPKLSTSLKALSLHRNKFQGDLDHLSKLEKLKSLSLFYNGLTGTVPKSLCDVKKLEVDCLRLVECSCCTTCCDEELGECKKQ